MDVRTAGRRRLRRQRERLCPLVVRRARIVCALPRRRTPLPPRARPVRSARGRQGRSRGRRHERRNGRRRARTGRKSRRAGACTRRKIRTRGRLRGGDGLQGHPLFGNHRPLVRTGRRRARRRRTERQAPPAGLPPALHHGQRRGAPPPGDAPLRPVRRRDEGADTLGLRRPLVLHAEAAARGAEEGGRESRRGRRGRRRPPPYTLLARLLAAAPPPSAPHQAPAELHARRLQARRWPPTSIASASGTSTTWSTRLP